MYKIIFSDLDGTLLSDDKTICQENIDAIKRAEEAGIKFLICTGRIPFFYDSYKNSVDISKAIAGNGQVIINNNEIIYIKYFDKEDLIKFVNYAKDNNVHLRIFTLDHLYSFNAEFGSPVAITLYNNTFVDYEEALKVVKEKDICKIGISAKTHEDVLKVRNDVNNMGLKFDIKFSQPLFADVSYKGISKGTGIKEYCNYLGIDVDETIGIGDNENDLEMLKTVGLACCPSNSTNEVKNKCKYICKNNNNDGAIKEIIDKFIFGKD